VEAIENRPDKPRIQTTARTVDILQYIARQSAAGVSAKQISDALSIPRQVVYHQIHTLVEIDMLRKIGGSSYALGFGVAALAEGFRRQLVAPSMMTEFAEQATQATGETAYVVGWIGGEIIVIATAKGTATVHAAEIAHGTARDAHARASGKMLLAMIPLSEVDLYFSTHQLRKRTENTVTDLNVLKHQLSEIRECGFAVEKQEYAEGLSCISVPLGKMPSQMVLGLSAPSDRFDLNVKTYIEQLKAIARR
jgi:DNA-binding IclR family transcriptional regulator